MRAPLYASDPSELFTSAAIEDPQTVYARLRREMPIARIAETGVHLVSTWDLIDEALGREDDFSANLTGVLLRGADGEPSTFDLPELGGSHVIATADDPDHAIHRALAQPRFAAAYITELEDAIRAWTREALAPWLAAGGGDFVPICERIPALVVARVLGLPTEDVSRHRTWAMMGGDILAGDVDQSSLLRLSRETGEMAQYLGEHLDRALAGSAADPGGPLLNILARGIEAGGINFEQAVGITMVMFGAGGESTAALIGSTARWLARDADLAHRLREDPEAIPRFVEEVARLDPPFNFHYRSVRRACELGGAELEPGDRLMLLWASANRDPSRFDDPDAMRLDRRHPKQHMSFGRGAHFCIGAPLARLEARVICEELLQGTTHLRLDPAGTPAHARSIFIHRLERLPLEARAA